ncbi:F-box protein At3g07870-like [Camellia sinensis]|uniref:F-box protein At3g07870-like n=1 Tax=Camellia sinensis TaxID=4442 RepID=UPI001035B3D0|nr:F-box protein At3g07870-like [Camellia sinensis]
MTNQIIPTTKKSKHSTLEQLPTQIILEILSRLPIKTLFLCQLVSKHWLSLISDPHFANLHLSRSPVSLLLKPFYPRRESRQLRLVDLQIAHSTHPRDAQLKFIPKFNYPLLKEDEIVNSCNGLLCLSDFTDDSDPIFICNPILGEYITLPILHHRGNYDATMTAFGFSLKTNQYKVVRFFLQEVVYIDYNTQMGSYREEAEAEIYTIGGEGLWRNMGKVPYHLTNHSFNSFVNGAIHWLNFNHDSPGFIRCFDFGTEEFRVVPQPLEFGLHREFRGHKCVGVLQDSLSICEFSIHCGIDIWMMKEYGNEESWSKEFVIGNVVNNKKGGFDYYEPIMVLKTGEILMLYNKDGLVLYDPKLGGFKKLSIYWIKSEFYGAAHIPSLVSLRDVAKGEYLSFL